MGTSELSLEEKFLRAVFGEARYGLLAEELTSKEGKAQRVALQEEIENILNTLTYREREVIKLRYGLGDCCTRTLEDVGKIFEVSRERVRQVETNALRKLKHLAHSRKLNGFFGGDA